VTLFEAITDKPLFNPVHGTVQPSTYAYTLIGA
jgi:hypothetical protein